ncbi:hypothetical protein C8255_05145 [filamentous cyanobacterium CCP3]|nr:hypothetical protein C8255_05145 [filamentous cyanobacterium CCP3]
MNAAEQANSIEFASKIAAVVGLFKAELPDLRADLKPWANDPDTRDLVDPDSIDLGFHFPGVSRLFQCRSLLVQIRLYTDPEAAESQGACPRGDSRRDTRSESVPEQSANPRVIGLDLAGFDHRGKRWTLSTIDNWAFSGDVTPDPTCRERLRRCCRQVFVLFNSPSESSPERG